jgi:hypothetical protein
MAEARASTNGDAEQQLSYEAFDNGNLARFNLTWLLTT